MEREAGLTDEKLIEAHGSFSSAHCIECEEKYEKDWLKGKVYTIVPLLRPSNNKICFLLLDHHALVSKRKFHCIWV